jgi:hypothetical protein
MMNHQVSYLLVMAAYPVTPSACHMGIAADCQVLTGIQLAIIIILSMLVVPASCYIS